MSRNFSPSSILYTDKVRAVKFGINGTEDNKKNSSIQITSYELFKNGKPYPGGLDDLKLGTIDHSSLCNTCFNEKETCLGHTGHINLNYPVYSPLFLGEIRKWLKLICFTCGMPIISNTEYIGFSASKRLTEASKLAKSTMRKCVNCGDMHPILKKRDKKDLIIILAEYYSDDKKLLKINKLYPHMVKPIFQRITNETVVELGKTVDCHPSKFVLNTIAVPPTTIRPDDKSIGDKRPQNNHLTTILKYLIKINDKIPMHFENINDVLEINIYELNIVYYMFVKGPPPMIKTDLKNIPKGQLNAVAMRLKGKQGRFRKTQMGKRVIKVGRSTIVNNPRLRIDEVGLPLYFARTLQIEEVVQEYNRDALMIYFQNGRNRYPGCSKIYQASTDTFRSVENINNDFILEIGDKVFRDLIDGDYVLFNRQPSLWPATIGAHRVVIIPDEDNLAIHMNVSACPWYNADFDGDAMNIYVVSPITARAEIQIMSHVSNWFIDHSNSLPWTGAVEDTIIGPYKMTTNGTLFNRYNLMMLFNNCSEIPDLIKSAKLTGDRDGISTPYTGYDIISLFLRNTPIDYKRDPSFYNRDYAPYINYDPADISTVIKNGIHVSGVLDKKAIGKGSEGSIFHIINSEYGANTALTMIYDLQQIAISYLYNVGNTIGIYDFIIDESAVKQIYEIESAIILKTNLITDKLNRGELIPPIGQTINHFYEQLMINDLRIMDDFSRPILQSIDYKSNQLAQTILSGCKGKMENMYHITSAIGQIIINGDRIYPKYTYKRTLPYFPRNDTSPESRGYITNSYIGGMTPSEVVFNTMSARFDLISKALTTATTGELTRKSVKNLETTIVNNALMCVKANNIIQLIYGEDGYDTRYVEKVKIGTIMSSIDDFTAKYKFVDKTNDKNNSSIFAEEFAQLSADRAFYRKTFINIENINTRELMRDDRMMPINIERYIKTIESKFGAQSPTTAELAEMVTMVRNFVAKLPYIYLNDIQERNETPIPAHLYYASLFMQIYTRSVLAATTGLSKLNKQLLSALFDVVKVKCMSAIVDYGSAIGVIAAQSFGGPLTQYMLDAHKRAVSGGTSRGGVNKAKDILSARTTEKRLANSMLITLDHTIEQDKTAVEKIANIIETMEFKQFVSVYQIFYEKFNAPVHPQYNEKSLIDEFVKFNPLLSRPADLIHWCIRFKLNKITMIHKNMQLETIINKFRELYPDLYFVYSPENSENIIIRVYLRGTLFKGVITLADVKYYGGELMNTIIRGVDGIINTSVVELVRSQIMPDQSIKQGAGIKPRYGISTIGTNIVGVSLISHVDTTKLMCDSPLEISDTLGIEAARTRLKTEIRDVGESSVSNKIFTMYADEMSYIGRITAIERGGLSLRETNNIMLRIGFASPIGTLEEAGINSMEDKIQGITAPIIIGTTPNIGTVYNKFYMNIPFIAANAKSADDILG